VKPRPELPPGPYLVVGLARSGVAAALALRAKDQQVIGVDVGTPAGLDALAAAGVELHVQEQGVGLLDRVNTVVKSPGVPANATVIAQAHARDTEIQTIGELELAWRLLPNEFIAVTGTNGKTTTVELLGHIHHEAGLAVSVAGNVGAALSGLVGRVEERAIVVCEASSFQLEDAIEFAPEAAVLLNLTPDHLDRHDTLEAYLQAKLRVFSRQDATDLAVLPTGFESQPTPGGARRVRFGRGPGAQLSESGGVLYWREQPLLAREEIRLRGRHNLENAMAAAAVCLARGVDAEAVRAGLRTFAGVPHRLEEVASREGVLFVNDSKATNVASTIVALEAMEEEGLHVHLILGGMGKGQDFTALRDPIHKGCRAVYLIGEDAGAIEQAIRDGEVGAHGEAGMEVRMCGELDRALSKAAGAAAPGEVVLFSPACASFDQFKDFEARGERFRELVLGL
jgi:UDP-N-acetylmuramoylalanine--D-glutamate ligase